MCLNLTGGYDSDVERERVIDYVSKTYVDPIRDASRPVLEEKPTSHHPQIKRKTASTPRVVTKEDKTEIKVQNGKFHLPCDFCRVQCLSVFVGMFMFLFYEREVNRPMVVCYSEKWVGGVSFNFVIWQF